MANAARLPLYDTIPNRIISVYWLGSAACRATEQPASVTKTSGPSDLTLSLVPAQVLPHQAACGGTIRIPGAAVVVNRPLSAGETVRFTVRYSQGNSSSHERP